MIVLKNRSNSYDILSKFHNAQKNSKYHHWQAWYARMVMKIDDV
jgi:hypothetical protein